MKDEYSNSKKDGFFLTQTQISQSKKENNVTPSRLSPKIPTVSLQPFHLQNSLIEKVDSKFGNKNIKSLIIKQPKHAFKYYSSLPISPGVKFFIDITKYTKCFSEIRINIPDTFAIADSSYKIFTSIFKKR